MWCAGTMVALVTLGAILDKDSDTVGLLIAIWVFVLVEITGLLSFKEFGIVELNETGLCQRSRGGYTFQFYS